MTTNGRENLVKNFVVIIYLDQNLNFYGVKFVFHDKIILCTKN